MSEPNAAQAVVEQFFNDWDEFGFEEGYRRHLGADAVWKNVGAPDCVGIDAIMKTLEVYNQVFKRPFCKVDIKHILSNGNLVLVERDEILYGKDHDSQMLSKNMSSFIVEDGKIMEWADYFDPTPYRDGSAVPK
jgi:limonene-1,2-epoxide hydrolase